MTQQGVWILAIFFALWAGVLDWRYRRIPNWLTVTGLLVGFAANSLTNGWMGAKDSLLGAGLGLLLLLPFVLLRALGGGDWKLVGAFGSFVGPGKLIDVLMIAVVIAGVMALCLIIVKGRGGETLRNIGSILGSIVSLRMPGAEVSLDNPKSAKIPFGVAMALAVLFYSTWHSFHVR